MSHTPLHTTTLTSNAELTAINMSAGEQCYGGTLVAAEQQIRTGREIETNEKWMVVAIDWTTTKNK